MSLTNGQRRRNITNRDTPGYKGRRQTTTGRGKERGPDNRVLTIKANPPATLIMVCRIDLSRSPDQAAFQWRPTRFRSELRTPGTSLDDDTREKADSKLYRRFTSTIQLIRKETYYPRQAANSTGILTAGIIFDVAENSDVEGT